MNFQESLDYLYERLPMYQRVGKAALKPNLENTERLLAGLGNPHNEFKTVHIAGTNGKGSSAHAIASILQSAGYKTGLYTSPHLKSFVERIKINGQPINEEAVAAFVSQVKDPIERIVPSFFEITVAMAFDYFRNEKVDIAIIEVGLGGRLDSTNVITPEVSLITNIGFDHTDLLGDTLPKIAAEKAGIIKKKVPVVIGSYQEETYPVFENKAQEMEAPFVLAEQTSEAEMLDAKTLRVAYKKANYYLDIPADYFGRNVPGVLETIEVLRQKDFRISSQEIRHGLAHVALQSGLKGRYQVLSTYPMVVADVSHNEDGVGALIQQVTHHLNGTLHVIYGTVKDKNVAKILHLFPPNAKFYWTHSHTPRSLPADKLVEMAESQGLAGDLYLDVNKALADAKKNADKRDLILITGSTFVVAEISGL